MTLRDIVQEALAIWHDYHARAETSRRTHRTGTADLLCMVLSALWHSVHGVVHANTAPPAD